jgi:hypothetical protein
MQIFVFFHDPRRSQEERDDINVSEWRGRAVGETGSIDLLNKNLEWGHGLLTKSRACLLLLSIITSGTYELGFLDLHLKRDSLVIPFPLRRSPWEV